MMKQENVDLIVHNGYIITMDDLNTEIVDGYIVINKGKIIELGKNYKVSKKYNPLKCLNLKGKFVIPGLINTHTHSADVLFRGLVEDLPLDRWLKKLLKVENQFVSNDTVYLGSLHAYIEMIKGGITTALDMYFHPQSLIKAAELLGIRLVTGPVFFDPEDNDKFKVKEEILKAVDFLNTYKNYPLLTLCLQPHSVYSVSPYFFSCIRELTEEYECLLSTHASETKNEVENCRKKFGCTPIQHLNSLKLLNNRTILAHCVHLSTEDFDILVDQGSIVSHCPVSNLKLASGIANIKKMIDKKIKVTLGTDGPVCGNDLNPWLTLRLAGLLQKTQMGDAAILPSKEILSLMTNKAAEYLAISDKIGSIEIGKQADILVIDNDKPHIIPFYDPYSALIYSIGREDVNTVLINGKIIMEERQLIDCDEKLIMEEIKKLSIKIKHFVDHY